jgi:hypothetical protein
METQYLIVILCALLAAFFTHRLAKRRDRDSLFNQAAERFRLGFNPVIEKLAHLSKPVPLHALIVDALMEGHEKRIMEMNELWLHLEGRKQRRFRKAWNEYLYPYRDNKEFKNKPRFEFADYLIAAEREGMKKAQALAIEKIGKLLSFTNLR